MFFKLTKLELRNFQSYGNNITTFNLDFNKSVLVIGRNLDSIVDGQVDSNGAGKTTMLNALSFGLFDKTITDIPLKDLINNITEKNMEVNIEFEKDNEYRVERYRQHKVKGGNGVTLYRKNDDGIFTDITKDAIGGVDKFLEELIGVPFEIFARIVVISATYQPFLELKLDPQRLIIEELFGFSELSKKAELLKESLKLNRKDIETLQKLDEQIKEEIARYTKLLNETRETNSMWNLTRDNEVSELTSLINNYNDIDFEAQEAILLDIDKLKNIVTTLEQNIIAIDATVQQYNNTLNISKKWEGERITDINKLTSELAALPSINLNEQQSLLSTLQDLKNNKRQKEQQLTSVKTAIATTTSDINKSKDQLTKLDQSIDDIGDIDVNVQQELLTQLNSSVRELNTVSSKIRELRANLVHVTKNLDRLKSDSESLTEEIRILNSSECPYCHQEYKDSECTKKLDANTTKLADIILQIKSDENIIIEINDSVKQLSDEQALINETIDRVTAQCVVKTDSELTALRNQINRINEDKNKLLTLLDVATKKLSDDTNVENTLNAELIDIDAQISKIDEIVEFKSSDELTKFSNMVSGKKSKLLDLENGKNPYLVNVTVDELITGVSDNTAKKLALITKVQNTKEAINTLSETVKYPDIKQLTIEKTTLMTNKVMRDKLVAVVNPSSKTLQSLLDNPPSELKTDQIQVLFDTIEHQEFLLKLLTKKDSFIRKALVNRYIPYLNTRIKYYLEKIGLPHKVEFQQNMTVKITQFKSELNFKNLSSGQKARVNLALSFAFRDVLQSRYGAINFCILDECLDVGLGNVGVQLATKMIKGIARDHNISMFVISHRDEISSMFDSKLVIELKNGYSNIISSDI